MKLFSISMTKSCHTTPTEADAAAANSNRTIALIGPPNSGKSTLFNRLTMLRQKVANYPGVTVEQRIGKLAAHDGDEVELVDATWHPRSDVIFRRRRGGQQGLTR